MAASPNGWVGSAYLFIQSDETSLSGQYTNNKAQVYKALRSALSDSIEILKIHSNDNQLILYLKFCGQEPCRTFIKSYRDCRVHQDIQKELESSLSLAHVPVSLDLRVDTVHLDNMLEKEDECLELISSVRPSRQKDDEFAELDQLLMNLTLDSGRPYSEDSGLDSPPHSLRTNGNSLPQGSTFLFQGEEFGDGRLTFEHHQLFAKSVGKKWKQVGRTLSKTCRALRDPAIENLAFELEKEGLYEQAYQLLRRFIDCEGKKATLQRLIEALVENDMTTIAQDLLSVQQNGL
ncbi:tumor necrosis factor receptor type 1-associated DEATH domain protein [Discoglossus pictus]